MHSWDVVDDANPIHKIHITPALPVLLALLMLACCFAQGITPFNHGISNQYGSLTRLHKLVQDNYIIDILGKEFPLWY